MSQTQAYTTPCKECGSTNHSWQTAQEITNGVQRGRLRTTDVKCTFVLGCNDCSATLVILSADKVAAMMNAAR